MKIGKFAEKFGVSRDTVRFYIRSGLLIPDESGAQLEFGERECRAMESILRMRRQKFSLRQIKRYLDIRRVSSMAEAASLEEILELLNDKHEELMVEIRTLEEICHEIEADVASLYHTGSAEKTGVPLMALGLLACPHCGGMLDLENASLGSRYVYSGDLSCHCGYHARIEDGIIRTGNIYTGGYDSPDLKRGLYRNVCDSFVTYFQKCMDLTRDRIMRHDLAGKVVLEAHINGYFFLYNNLSYMEKDCLYVIVDKYPEMLEMYKSLIDRINPGLRIIYLADNSMNWPLRKKSVDLMVSFMGDNEHSLYYTSPYIDDVKPFLKEEAEVVGAVIGFPLRTESLRNVARKYPEGGGAAFAWDVMPEYYRASGYTYDRELIGTMTETCSQYTFECHKRGEELRIGCFTAKPMKNLKP